MINRMFGPTPAKKQQGFPYRPFIGFGIIVAIAMIIRVVNWVQGPDVPTADVPAIGVQDVHSTGTQPDAPTDVPTGTTQPDAPTDTSEPDTTNTTPTTEIPDSYNLAVPFTSQAPFGVWDAMHEDACEEASLYMALRFYAGDPAGPLDPTATDKILNEIVNLETSLGYGLSISAEQLQETANKYNGTVLEIIDNPTAETLKSILANGDPIIVPAKGRELGNPFFTGEGPLYHMLVLKGYTATQFIANDPGTRHGENYQYDIDVLMNAIGDWDGDSPDGGLRVLVVKRQ